MRENQPPITGIFNNRFAAGAKKGRKANSEKLIRK